MMPAPAHRWAASRRRSSATHTRCSSSASRTERSRASTPAAAGRARSSSPRSPGCPRCCTTDCGYPTRRPASSQASLPASIARRSRRSQSDKHPRWRARRVLCGRFLWTRTRGQERLLPSCASSRGVKRRPVGASTSGGARRRWSQQPAISGCPPSAARRSSTWHPVASSRPQSHCPDPTNHTSSQGPLPRGAAAHVSTRSSPRPIRAGPGGSSPPFPNSWTSGASTTRRSASPSWFPSRSTAPTGAPARRALPRKSCGCSRTDGDLRIGDVHPVRVGGVVATQATIAIRRTAKPGRFCFGQCAPLVSRQRVTQLVSAPARGRLTLVDVRGHPVAVLEDTPDGTSLSHDRAARTEPPLPLIGARRGRDEGW